MSIWAMRAAEGSPAHRWVGLLIVFRALATATAVALLAVHKVTEHDSALLVAATVHGVVATVVLLRFPRARASPVAWGIDIAVVYLLIWFSGDWRSPFYLLSLTALSLPAAAIGARRAVLLGVGWTGAYLVAAHEIGPDPLALGTQASVETLATHLVLPGLVCLGIGYATDALRRLEIERADRQLLAIEAERRRIAWELHDSAKQRVHAAHLLLSSLPPAGDERVASVIALAAGELQAASADMDTSLAELRSPLEGRPLGDVLRERAEQLSVAGGPPVAVTGEIDGLPPTQAAHAYRIAGEAITNAVRHARASRVSVMLERDGDDATVTVVDDGCGMPAATRPGSTGLLAMRNRTKTIGGRLRISASPDGIGTAVELRFPVLPPRPEPEV